MANKEAKQIKRFVEDTSKEVAKDAYGSKIVVVPEIINLEILNGLATWDEPDLSEIEVYEPDISYLIYVNGEFIQEQEGRSFQISNYANVGNNSLAIITKAILHRDSSVVGIVYSASYSLKKLDVIVGGGTAGYAACRYGQHIYLFGGRQGPSNYVNTIFKYDTLTDTYTTLETTLPVALGDSKAVLVGNYIYIFGGKGLNYSNKNIYRFNVKTEKLDSSLEAEVNGVVWGFGICTYNNFIYIVGGYDFYNTPYNTIQKYDTTTDTITIISSKLPYYMADFGYVTIGNILWMFGGFTKTKPYGSDYAYTNKTYTFNMFTEKVQWVSDATPSWLYYTGMECASIGNDIYMFGCHYGLAGNLVIKLDTATKTFTTLNVTFDISGFQRSATVFDNTIYEIGVFEPGGLNRNYYGYVYKFEVAEDEENE